MDDDAKLLIAGAAALSLTLTADQVVSLLAFREILLIENGTLNLTAITDPAAVLHRHVLDSLSVALAVPVVAREQPLHVIDVGTGGGLPALPLAIAFPHWQVTALDSIGKKVRAVERMRSHLGLHNVIPLVGRAEDMARLPVHRESYHLVVARAVAALPTLLEYLLPLCARGGEVIAMKKGELSSELAAGSRAASQLGAFALTSVDVPPIADLDDQRVLIVAHKKNSTPAAYPRRPGLARQLPLGAG